MDNRFVRLNTVLMIPDHVASDVIALSKSLGEHNDAHFVLDGKDYYPHITLYSPEYPTHNLNEVFNRVQNIATNQKSIQCAIGDIRTGEGFISLEVELTKELNGLHTEVVAALNPLREDHVREKYVTDYQIQFSDEKIENIKKFGYPNSMSLYRPHLTVIRLKDKEKAEALALHIDFSKMRFVADKIGVYEMGEHGTCRKLLKEYAVH